MDSQQPDQQELGAAVDTLWPAASSAAVDRVQRAAALHLLQQPSHANKLSAIGNALRNALGCGVRQLLGPTPFSDVLSGGPCFSLSVASCYPSTGNPSEWQVQLDADVLLAEAAARQQQQKQAAAAAAAAHQQQQQAAAAAAHQQQQKKKRKREQHHLQPMDSHQPPGQQDLAAAVDTVWPAASNTRAEDCVQRATALHLLQQPGHSTRLSTICNALRNALGCSIRQLLGATSFRDVLGHGPCFSLSVASRTRTGQASEWQVQLDGDALLAEAVARQQQLTKQKNQSEKQEQQQQQQEAGAGQKKKKRKKAQQSSQQEEKAAGAKPGKKRRKQAGAGAGAGALEAPAEPEAAAAPAMPAPGATFVSAVASQQQRQQQLPAPAASVTSRQQFVQQLLGCSVPLIAAALSAAEAAAGEEAPSQLARLITAEDTLRSSLQQLAAARAAAQEL